MKIPGPDHPISVDLNSGRLRIRFADQVVAETTRALTLKEATYPPVFYIPRADVDFSLLRPSDRRTRCPYKGEASYFTIVVGDARAADAVWSYERPSPAVAAIAGCLAFYPQHVVIEELDG